MQGQYARALQQLDGVRTSGATAAEQENIRGLALMMSGQTAKAIEHFDRALKLRPDLHEARLNRAITRLRAGDAAPASTELQALHAAETSPSIRTSAAYHNALALDRLGKARDAEQWLERALATEPAHDGATLYLGILRERRGDLQGAGRAYLDFLQRHPDSIVAMLRLGVSAQRAGRADVASKYLKRVMEVAPASEEAAEARKFLVLWD